MTAIANAKGPAPPIPPLAYAPEPLPGEPLDGYLEYVAHGLGVPHRGLHRHLGLKSTTAYALVRDITTTDAENLARATGIPAHRWIAMTLRRYAHIQLMPPPDKRGHGTGVWARGSGARYCPDCLRERGLRWLEFWYVQWSFACARHQRLLLTRCPRCQRPVRSRAAGHPVTSATPHRETTALDGCDCATSILADADAIEGRCKSVAPACILAAQQSVHDVIHEDARTVTAFGRPVSRIEWLNDVAALTRLLATYLPTDHIPQAYVDILSTTTPLDVDGRDSLPAILTEWGSRLALGPTVSPAARLRDTTLSPVAMALTATAAITIVSSATIPGARELLEVLPASARSGAAGRAHARKLSWALVMALDPRKGRIWRGQAPSYRIKTARLRPDGSERPPLDPAKVPACLWRSALEPHGLRHHGYTALAGSAALLSVGTDPNIKRASERLGHLHLAGRVQRDISVVLGLADPDSTEFFDDLLSLHDLLATTTVPIDYARRRRTFPLPVPPAARTARRIARELGLRPTPRLTRYMGWWVFEELTGNDVLLREQHLQVHASHRIAYARQRDVWNADPPVALLRRAEHALLVNRLDEPLVWSPLRSADGGWVCAPTDTKRLLAGWTNRRGRRSSRPGTGAVEGLQLREAVAFAASGQSLAADRLAVRIARFAVVVEVGTITQAAKRIGIRQPTVSACLTTLERDLSVTLLDRGTHGFTITPAGRELQRLACEGAASDRLRNTGSHRDHSAGSRPNEEPA